MARVEQDGTREEICPCSGMFQSPGAPNVAKSRPRASAKRCLAVRQPAQHRSQIGVVRVEQDEAREEVRPCGGGQWPPRPFEGGAVRIEVSLHRVVIDRQDNVRALGEEGGESDFNGIGHEKS